MASGAAGVSVADYMRSAPVRRLRHPLDDSPVWSLLGSALGALLSLLVGLPVLLTLAVLLPLSLAARWLLLLLYWNRRRPLISAGDDSGGAGGGGAESMRGNDCRWLGAAWRSSVLHAVLVFDSRVELPTLQRLLLARVLPAYPRLTHRLHKLPLTAGAGHCWLPDPHFDIDRHVFHGPCLPTDIQLQGYVSQLVSEGLQTDKPPWELQVLEGGGRAGTTTVLRVHQSVADGPALLSLLCRCLADTKVYPNPPSRSEQSVGYYCKVLRSCVFGPLTVCLWLLLSARDCNLLTQSTSWSGQTTVSWSAAITLSKVTRVKQVTRSTVNCVLLSALAGALRILLQSCGVRQPPDLRVVLPVNLRSSATARTDSRLGSQMAPVVVTLPVGVEGAVPRLWSTRRALRALRQSSDALIVYLTTAALMSLVPAQSARRILSAFTEQKASLQFSSLVGPSAAVLVGGCPLKSVYSLLPAQSGLSMSVSVLIYADQVFVAVSTDSSLGPAGTIILSHIQAQVELMYTLLQNRRVPGETKAETVLYRFPDVTRSPVRELASRLTLVQGEVERLSRSDTSHETERLHRLRAEFSHLLRELRKRRSLSEMEPWDVQWRSRRRAMSCSFARRPSISVVSLLSSNRPASVIETSNHILSPMPKHFIKLCPTAYGSNPINSTIAFNDAPSTSDHQPSVFNVNYQSENSTPSLDIHSSPFSAPKNNSKYVENTNQISDGLYDEILSALKSHEMLGSANDDQPTNVSVTRTENESAPQTNNRSNCRFKIETRDIENRDHVDSTFLQAKTEYKHKSNLRKFKSKTMNSIYQKGSRSQRWPRRELWDGLEGRSRSCNILSNCHSHRNDYEVAIESLSDFATNIRRLSFENTIVDKSYKTSGPTSDTGNLWFCSKRKSDNSRRHSTIPLRKVSCSTRNQIHDNITLTSNSSQNTSVPVQPCIYEFV